MKRKLFFRVFVTIIDLRVLCFWCGLVVFSTNIRVHVEFCRYTNFEECCSTRHLPKCLLPHFLFILLLISLYSFHPQSGCCKPPDDCSFAYVSPTNWTTQSNSSFTDPDCGMWNNDPSVLCFNCESCKGGVLDNIKHDWKKVAIVNVIFLVFLVIVYSIGCCAFRNNREDNSWNKYPRRYPWTHSELIWAYVGFDRGHEGLWIWLISCYRLHSILYLFFCIASHIHSFRPVSSSFFWDILWRFGVW